MDRATSHRIEWQGPREGKWFCTSPLAILLVAGLIRGIYLWVRIHAPGFSQDVVNRTGTEAWNIARSIVEGKGFSSPFGANTGPTAWLTPIYPYLLAGIFKIFGEANARSVIVAAILNQIFSAVTVVPIFYIGERLQGRITGAVAAWIWVIHPFSIYVAYYWLWYNSLSALLTALIVWATIAVRDSRRMRDWIGYGTIWGTSLLTNAAVMALLPFFYGWIVWSKQKEKGGRELLLPSWSILVLLLICSPWVARNYMTFHQILPLRSDFGFELWVENHAGVVETSEDNALFLRLGEVAYCRERGREALQFFADHPRAALSSTWGRFLETWTGDGHPVQKFLTRGWGRRMELILYTGLSVLALGGLIVLFREGSEFRWLLAAPPVVFPVVYYITHTSFAYRLPIDPVLVVLSAPIIVRLAWPWRLREGTAKTL